LNSKLSVLVLSLLLVSTSALAQEAVPGADIEVGPSVVETNPAVRAALELPRETPADYFQAIIWLLDLGRPELAKPILSELSKLQLTGAQRAELVGEFGSRDMLLLARAKELAPEGAAFAESCMAAATAAATDPKRIAALVGELTDASAQTRQMAVADLAATGQPGAIAALEALAREPNANRRAAIAAAIARMQPFAEGPLLAMLETSDPALRAEVAALLDRFSVPQAVPLLPSTSASAQRAMTSAMENVQAGVPPFSPDDADQVELWQWDDAARKLTSARLPAKEARIAWMARLARHLARLRPHDERLAREALLVEMESSQFSPSAAAGESVKQALGSAWLRTLNEMLSDALRLDYDHAAEMAIDALGKRGDARLLFTPDAQPSPLANALGSSNRRVRFAALRAIMALDPAAPYPGSSRVPEALVWFAGSTVARWPIWK
jgi:hypothetical protein